MKSYFARTDEIDDLEIAVKELKQQIDKPLMKNSVGIIITDFEVDIRMLISKLKEQFDFPFIGGTSIATLCDEGYVDQSISMIVLTDDKTDFAIGITREMQNEKDLIGIDRMYGTIYKTKGRKENLIFALGVLSGNGWEVGAADDFVERLDRLSGGAPVVGGLSGDDMTFKYAYVFTNDGFVRSGLAALFIYGEVKTLCISESSIASTLGEGWEVTKSQGHNVYSLNGNSVKEEFAKIGLVEENADVTTNFLSLPFINDVPIGDGDEVRLVRSLAYFDGKEDCCGFMANVKEGSHLVCGNISEQIVSETVSRAFDGLLEKMSKEKDYEYSIVFCVSCIARYCIIAANKTTEANGFVGRLPAGVHLLGFYSFGEMMPVKGKKKSKYYNSFCNETFAVFAI